MAVPPHRCRDTARSRPYSLGVLLTVLVLSIFGLAVLMVVGTALYGLVLAVGTGLASLVTDVRDRLLPRTTGDTRPSVTETPPHSVTSGEGLRAEAPEPSTEVMWHRMQGTSKKSRRRGTDV